MALSSYCQSFKKNGLDIGDTVPDVLLKESIQNSLTNAKLSDYKGRLVLLDFWSTGCIGCILGMPQLDTLQNYFGDQIKTIIVCNDNRTQIERTFKGYKKKYPQTPVIIGDSILHKMFPHMTVPHHVWIDQYGVVRFITYDHNATIANVKKFLNKEPLHLSLRKQITDYNSKAQLFDEGKGRWNNKIKYHTLFATYLEGVEHTEQQLDVDTASNSQTLRLINFPYYYLFMVAYNGTLAEGPYWLQNRWVLDVKDTVNLMSNVEVDSLVDRWNNNGVASYEAVIQGSDTRELFKTMRRDLNSYSPYTAWVEKRKIKCYILFDDGLKPTTYKGKDSVFVCEANGATTIKNYTVKNSVWNCLVCQNETSRMPVVDETNYTSKVDLSFSKWLNNLDDSKGFQEVQKELKKNGLGIKVAEREIEMLIIKDKQK